MGLGGGGEGCHVDVFVSFRGSDVRYKFVDHLFAALRRKKVVAFRDTEERHRGEGIKRMIRRAINKSTFYVVVLTRNYASSPWCLDELVDMMNKKVVFPVFYHVLPEDFSAGIDRHRGQYARERVDTWGHAIGWIVGIAGWVISAGQYVKLHLDTAKLRRHENVVAKS
ncbi:Disease resistance protein RPV1 [Linum perenne]